MASDLTQLETLFLALGDRTRLRLLSLMAAGPMPVGLLVDLTGESQPKVSRHLAYLRNCGVVTTRREGKQVYYGIDLAGDSPATQMLATVIASLTGKPAGRSEQTAKEPAARRLAKPVKEAKIYADTDMNIPERSEPIESFEEAAPDFGARDEPAEMDVFLL